MRKGQIWVSAVLYILIVSVAIVLVLSAGLPLLNQMKDKTAYTRTRDTMLSLDKHIEDITAEGEGSQRVVAIEIRNGELTLGDGELVWELETEAEIIEPRSKIEYGNLVVSSGIDVSATTYSDYYLLENTYLIVNISRFNGTTEDTVGLINSVVFKGTNVTIPGNFSFMIGSDAATATGVITTMLLPGDSDTLDFASVIAQVNSSSIRYDLELTLESKADFLTTRIRRVY